MSGYRKILVAADVPGNADILLQKAVTLASLTGAEILLLHVIEPIVMDSAYDILPASSYDIDEQLHVQAREKLYELADNYDISRDNVIIEVGAIKERMSFVTDELGIDLIVVGSRCRHGIALIMGSTVNSIMHGVECDVLAVHLN